MGKESSVRARTQPPMCPPPSPGAHMKLLIICFVSSELRELAKLMKEQ